MKDPVVWFEYQHIESLDVLLEVQSPAVLDLYSTQVRELSLNEAVATVMNPALSPQEQLYLWLNLLTEYGFQGKEIAHFVDKNYKTYRNMLYEARKKMKTMRKDQIEASTREKN